MTHGQQSPGANGMDPYFFFPRLGVFFLLLVLFAAAAAFFGAWGAASPCSARFIVDQSLSGLDG
jgi:hypothetical protein